MQRRPPGGLWLRRLVSGGRCGKHDGDRLDGVLELAGGMRRRPGRSITIHDEGRSLRTTPSLGLVPIRTCTPEGGCTGFGSNHHRFQTWLEDGDTVKFLFNWWDYDGVSGDDIWCGTTEDGHGCPPRSVAAGILRSPSGRSGGRRGRVSTTTMPTTRGQHDFPSSGRGVRDRHQRHSPRWREVP